MRISPFALCLTLTFAAQAHAQAPVPVATPKPAAPRADPAEAALQAKLAALIEKSGLGGGLAGGIGAVVADVATGKRLYTLNPEVPRNPASNMKVLTAATALTELGPEYRLRTTVSGAPDPHGHVPSLLVRGEGDPSLSYADLLDVARRLLDAGVHEVDEIVIDGSYFDAQILPPAFEQQPKEIAAFRAAVAAVSVDRNAYTLRLLPGAEADAPAQASLHCPDHFALDAQLTTSAGGAPKVSAEQTPRGDQLALVVRGSVPMGSRNIGYERRVESPLAYAGHCMRAALRTHGIAGAQAVRVGKLEDAPPLLVTHESAPLSVLLQRVGKYSDNFVAEMLLKVIGARASGAPGSSRAGVARGEALLAKLGVAKEGVQLVNGSGLFEGGSLSPNALVALLLYAQREPSIRAEYLSQLAIAGKDGTLATRLVELKPARVVRAKTGTLDGVVALTGYVLGPPGGRTLAFSILTSDVSGKQRAARDLTDEMVRALVRYCYP